MAGQIAKICRSRCLYNTAKIDTSYIPSSSDSAFGVNNVCLVFLLDF